MKRVAATVERHPVFTVFAMGLVIRMISVSLIKEGWGGGTFGVGDDTTYSWMAEWMARGLADTWNDYTKELYNSTATFTVPLTLIYIAFGSVDVGGPLLAATFGAATAALLTRLGLEIVPKGWAMAAGLGLAWFPSQVLWSSLTLKDSAVWATLASIAILAAVGARTRGWKLLTIGTGIAVVLFLLGHLRAHTLVVACWAITLGVLFSIATAFWERVVGTIVIAVGVPWLLGLGPAGFSLVMNQDLEYRRTANAFGAATAFIQAPEPSGTVASTEVAQTVLAQIEDKVLRMEGKVQKLIERGGAEEKPKVARALDRLAQLQERREAAAAWLQQFTVSSLPQGSPENEDEVLSPTIRHLPKGISVMLFEPYPWAQTENGRVRLAQLESLLWYPLLALAAFGLLVAFHDARVRRALAYPVLCGVGVLLVYASSEGNFGTAYRHRGEVVWVVILLAVVGAHRIWGREENPVSPPATQTVDPISR